MFLNGSSTCTNNHIINK